MAGGRGKINEHPNAGKNSLKHRKEDINKNGRPKKIYTVVKEKGYSKDDLKTALNEIAWYDESDINEALNDKKKPHIIRIVANQLKEAFDNGDWAKIKEIMEHVLGKPTQPLANDEESPLIKSTPVVFADGRTLEDVMKEIKE